jgi:serine acetyltransferase
MQGDIRKKMQLLGRSGAGGWLSTVFDAGSLAVFVYRFAGWTMRLPGPTKIPFKVIYFILFYLVQAATGISVQAYAKIGRRFAILNHYAVFVVAERIGDDFTVCQGVTVGNVRGAKRLPVIGNNVFLEPGCKILGDVTIGDNVVVRANSLVLNDVPSNSIAVGNPARILKRPPEDTATA